MGGLPENYCYLVLGGPGAGKTTFGVQYLVNGVLNNDYTGIYVTFSEPPSSVIMNSLYNFGWDLISLENKMKLAIVDTSPVEADVSAKTLRLKRGSGYG